MLSGRLKWVDSLSKKSQLILIFFIGFTMGTVFVFGSLYWSSEVDRDECITIFPTYESHKLSYEHTDVKEIILYFSNEEIMSIDGVSINDELIEQIEKIDKESKIIIIKHPNSSSIMEMVVNGIVLLDFDTTMSQIVKERNGFIILGIVLYLFAVYSIIELIKVRKKK